ncbi:Indoleamine 2,3-dioxygenase [Thermothelomyces heterothallicus CBS 202.75]|uniref:Indoleamine 2,3-dioxygenase n=1 Tax=Thermothelomyces heterothallicus CBS 202.75 TaxID=1149848 RepID=UPI003743E237
MSPSETLTFNSRGASTEVLPMPLNEYAVTSNGFLPEEPPLGKLPNPYYGPWESLVECLPDALASRTLRDQVHQLPILSTDRLTTEPEWRRACVILGFLAHAYIWGGDTAAETLPPQITLPFLAVTTHLGTPPVATFASLSLWNFEVASTSTNTASTTPSNTTPPTSVPDRDPDLTDPDALRALHTFTGTADESWFYTVSVAMEAEGARLLPVLLRAMHALFAARRRDQDVPLPAAAAAVASRALRETTACIGRLGRLLDRMDERCRPDVFYHQIRPFLAGSKNMAAAGLPRGVFYAESAEGGGEAEGKANAGKGEWRQLRGGSNGQSSLVQFLDIALGVEHLAMGSSGSGGQGGKPAVGFHEEVRGYMPEPHRRFLEDVAARYPGGLRKGVEELLAAGGEEKGGLSPELAEVREAFRTATRALAEFRNKHLQMVTRYIIIPSRQQNTRREVNLATASSKLRASSSAEAKEKAPAGGGELTGTGGTALMPFLKQTRDETFQAGRLEY